MPLDLEDMPDVAECLIVRPGDVLIVRIADRIANSVAADLKAAIQARLPGLASVVVISADGLAVYRDPTHEGGINATSAA